MQLPALLLLLQAALVVVVGNISQQQSFLGDGQEATLHGGHLQENKQVGLGGAGGHHGDRVRVDGSETHGSRGRCVQVHDAAHVGPDAVDGAVRTEAAGIHREGGGPLLDDLTQDVDLHLKEQKHQQHQSE